VDFPDVLFASEDILIETFIDHSQNLQALIDSGDPYQFKKEKTRSCWRD